jgi:HEAT repeat protein
MNMHEVASSLNSPEYELASTVFLVELSALVLELVWLTWHRLRMRLAARRAATFARLHGDRLLAVLRNPLARAEWIQAARAYPRQLVRTFLEPLLPMTEAEAREALGVVWRALGFLDQDLAMSRSLFWNRRVRAMRRLCLMAGPSEAPALVARAQDRHLIRVMAAQTLVRVGTPEQLRDCISKVTLPSRLLEQPMVEALSAASPAQMEALLGLLASPADPSARRIVLTSAARTAPGACLQRIPEAIRSPEKEVRIGACLAAGMLGTPELVAPLLAALIEDPAFEVRAHAAKALGRLRAPEAMPLLCRAMQDRAFWVRQNAAASLREYGEEGRRKLEEVAAQDKDRFAADTARQELHRLGASATATATAPTPAALAAGGSQ